jgi:hypothetical protein
MLRRLRLQLKATQGKESSGETQERHERVDRTAIIAVVHAAMRVPAARRRASRGGSWIGLYQGKRQEPLAGESPAGGFLVG